VNRPSTREPWEGSRTLRRAATAAACVAALVAFAAGPGRARADEDDATSRARAHYEMGLRLFDAREHDQALIEFDTANELKPRPAAVFMMAQCEYLLGRLKEARTHYEAYIKQSPGGEFVELARDRIQSIDRRPGTFVINTVPDEVDVRIVSENDPGRSPVTGQAPNNFPVPSGRYRITVSKKNYAQQSRVIDIDLAETKPLFFKLDEIPARLEIVTDPPGATLYVNGNRARNPYHQDVAPGHFEIIGEAVDHDTRTLEFALSPGERKLMTGPDEFRLAYTQRSGRPELVVASMIIGGFFGAGAVAAAIGKNIGDQNVATVTLTIGGGLAGTIAGALVATSFVPHYIPDNRALFIIGATWIGGAEGAMAGFLVQQAITSRGPVVYPCPGREPCRGPIGEQLRAGFLGSIPGLAVGLTAGALTSARAPSYGRVALIQSAAFGGAVMGALAQVGARWHPFGSGSEYTLRGGLMNTPTGEPAGHPPDSYCIPDPMMTNTMMTTYSCAERETSVLDLMPGALIGLNVGLAAGLLGAYLPDQSPYISWKRILLIDLATAAGAVAGGVGGCVTDVKGCLTSTPDDQARASAALAAMGGAAVGLVGGYFLTRHFDDDRNPPPPADKPKVTLSTTLMPLRTADGSTTPAIGAFGTF
jgi:hypothetical protein